jgi:hypothetical protein
MKALETWRSQNPSRVQANKSSVEAFLRHSDDHARGLRLQAIVTIPIVFHIVLPNPFIVSDADIQAQVDRLNLDYSGRNSDSTNIPVDFQAVRGHSQLRFVLAKRTPAGQPTNGIERRSSSTPYDVFASNDPVKSSTLGGLNAWDASKYLNVWVGTGGDILGYATFPGAAGPTEQGVVIVFTGTSNNACYVDTDYNMGRTLTHETGHFFGLYHIWGDDSGCTSSDFDNLPGTCLITDPTLAGSSTDQSIGDTPNQGDENFGCQSGIVSNNCGNASGDMYQNFMDYTNDACMTMFTKKQTARMEWVVTNCLPGFLTSEGGIPPAGVNNWDAAPVSSINPGGFEITNCAIHSYTDVLSCEGNIAPKFLVTNNGSNPITSLVAGYRLDNEPAVFKTVNMTIPTGGSSMVSFADFPVLAGNHTFQFFTANPNGNADQVPTNDTIIKTFRVLSPLPVPVVADLEATLPVSNFTIDNPDGDASWERTIPGRNGSAGKLSIDNYNNDTQGTFDDFRSAPISVNPASAYILSFDLAHKNYPNALFNDTLSVLISSDCGRSFTTVFKKWGAQLATAGSYSDAYLTPAPSDWKTESVHLSGAVVSSGKILVIFRNSGRYGNVIHLDNIYISGVGGRDLRIVRINAPGATSCSPSISPSVTVINEGAEEVTSFKIGYRVDNGTNTVSSFNQAILSGQTTTVSLPTGNASPGSHSFTVFSADPISISGIGDARLNNDTLSTSFSVVNLINAPVVEGFETAFPPTGWTIFNPDNNVTWVRRAAGSNSQYSVFFDNYNNNIAGQVDDIGIPNMNVAGADSVIISFDIAHRNYPGASDSLLVLATDDCGNRFTTVYKKGGASLATGGSTTEDYQAPTNTDWRGERISLGSNRISMGSLGVTFRNKSDYGNNIFVDNISVLALFRRDLQVVAINHPGTITCANSIAPVVTVRNNGMETIHSFKFYYTINGGNLQIHSVSGVNLTRDNQLAVTLPVSSLSGPGSYHLVIYSSDPVGSSGAGDLNNRNDTLRPMFLVPGVTEAPLTETFASVSFPPVNWSILNQDNNITWKHIDAGNGTQGSAYLNTFNYPVNGQIDELTTPIIKYDNADSVHLSFDLAAATYSYPGTTAIPIDTLEVLVSKDCGNTFHTVYKKWGYELQTINQPNTPQINEFFPASANEWRRERIDLTQYNHQSSVLIVFRVINNYENNIFIDNVDFTATKLPLPLKEKGYLVLPTAFQNSFKVWHFQTPTDLKSIQVSSASGQVVWSKQYNGMGDRQISIDLTGKASGVYFVEVNYNNGRKRVAERVVKY